MKNKIRSQTPSEAILGLRLPKEIDVRLEKLAKATKRSKSYYAKQAIINYLDTHEELLLASGRSVRDRDSSNIISNAMKSGLLPRVKK